MRGGLLLSTNLIWRELWVISGHSARVTPSVTLASVRGPFSPLWPPLPCSQKRSKIVLPAQFYRDSKSPTARV